MSRDYKRGNYLRREAEIAHRNAKAADIMGRYAEADWWESRAQELLAEIEKRDEMADIPAEKCEEAHDG